MGNSNIKVSVVVTTYNQEATIARTLDSILAQQCKFPFEICLSDDFSTDSTPEICATYAERYPDIIRYHHNFRNRGCRDNYFDTLLRCRGEYIADCAGDDYWIHPLKLSKQAAILDSDPQITLVHTGWEYRNSITGAISPADPQGEKSPYLKPVSDYGELFIPTLQHKAHSIIHLCTAMYRKDVFTHAYDDDPTLFRNVEFPCEDLQLSVVYAHAGKIAYMPDITMRYSIGHNSVSSQESYTKTFDFYIGSLKLTIYMAEKFNVPYETMRECYSDMTSFLFAQAYFAHDKGRLDRLLSLISDKQLPLSLKSRIYLPSTATTLGWKAGVALKKTTLKLRALRQNRS